MRRTAAAVAVRRTAAAAVAVLLALGACRDDSEPAATPPADRPSSSTTTGAPAATAAPPSTAAPGPEDGPGAAANPLRPDGLGDLDFGAAQTQAVAALTQALGPPESDDTLPPGSCSGGATRSLTWGDLNVLFGPDGDGQPVLYGWTYGTDEPPAAPALATGEGIGVGSTRRALEAAYGDRVEVSGDETAGAVRFTVAGARGPGGVPLNGGGATLSGLLTGPAADATVRALFAGSYCGE